MIAMNVIRPVHVAGKQHAPGDRLNVDVLMAADLLASGRVVLVNSNDMASIREP